MTQKRIWATAIIVAILGALVYLQFRTWRKFDWSTFASVTGDVIHGRGLAHLLIAISLIWFTYWLRAVRWKIFLKPVCNARLSRLTPTQFIGFTGVALLGRLGELIRPYLVAKKENLSLASQIGVWTVERIFDAGGFAVLVSVDVFLFGSRLPHPAELRIFAAALLAMVAVMAAVAYLIRRNGPGVAEWLEQRLSPVSPKLGASIAHKVRSFGEGLHTIHDGASFLQLVGVSLLIWFVISLAYVSVLHAYPQDMLHHMHVPQVMLLMASSMAGSVIQLPAVGGGSQLAMISMLSSVEWFAVPKELAVSAGMLIWLATFMSVVPLGLFLAQMEHVSLRKLSKETEEAEAVETA
jgi:glycosyltransferase 2 family protein